METDHPIIDKPWEYNIVEFRYHVDLRNWKESFIDLHLKKGIILRRLRFFSPQNLKIEQGFPQPTHGLCILDIRSRQLEGFGVEVSDFEAGRGSITFLASEVVDLDRDVPDNGFRYA